jgi:hypothetical protein
MSDVVNDLIFLPPPDPNSAIDIAPKPGILISDYVHALQSGEVSPGPCDVEVSPGPCRIGEHVSDFAHATVGVVPPTPIFGDLTSDFAISLHTGEGSPPPDDRGQLVSGFVFDLHHGIGGV